MKTIMLCLFAINCQAQIFTKNDFKICLLTAAAGYTTGLRDEVNYHPKAFMERHPNLNPTFWDNRVQGKKGLLNMEWNADHVLKGATVLFFTAAVTLKIGEKKKWYYYFIDAAKYYLSYHAGFFLSYNLQEKNKL
jgi:hypothetical protein